jgi:hypothetical protein
VFSRQRISPSFRSDDLYYQQLQQAALAHSRRPELDFKQQIDAFLAVATRIAA